MALDPKTGKPIPAFRPDNPDKYGGGRMDDFIATIGARGGYLMPYHGKDSTKHYLFGAFDLEDIEMRDGNTRDPYTVRYFAGYFTSTFGPGTYPSNDGETPAGGTVDDYKALGEGTMTITPGDEDNYIGVTTCGSRVRPDAEWSQALDSIMKAPLDGTDGVWDGWGEDGSCLAGLRVHFGLADRTDGKKGKGDSGQDRKTLVITRVVAAPGAQAVPAAAKATTPATKPTATPAGTKAQAPAVGANGANVTADPELMLKIQMALADAPNQSLPVMPNIATGIVMAHYAGDNKRMQLNVPATVTPGWHAGAPWTYNPVTKVLTLTAVE